VAGIRRLQLSDFRNYTALDMACPAGLVALYGENGSGKTNILEALSLFSPGRGLRRADFTSIAREGGSGGFAVAVEADGRLGDVALGVGTQADEPGRRCRIDRETVSSAQAFADHLSLIWLTPENDGLFRGAAGDRRRFLDRLVQALDGNHGTRVAALERSLRARNKLLEEGGRDQRWLDAVERELAEQAVAVSAARAETIARLQPLCATSTDDAFPFAIVALQGPLEERLAGAPALEVEDWYREELAANRSRDQAAGRTLTGPNTADLVVRHGPKDMPAEQSSTGEQKALLIGLVLAHARLVSQLTGAAPLVLLDEVAAHLDQHRRQALYKAVAALGSQIWMTGTDRELFDSMPEGAMTIKVDHGSVFVDPGNI
jgi:DNA replication and repair protein RecF